jgi:hypothetical protein
MWCILRERNSQNYEDCERTIVDYKKYDVQNALWVDGCYQ